MTWIVTGGAGYIGAHVVRAMRAEGRAVVVFDDLSTGRAARLPAGVELVRGSVTRADDVRALFAGRPAPAGVVHLAALKSVAGSVAAPERYHQHNVIGLRTLLDAMTEAGVGRLLFSSSAAVYGRPGHDVVHEESATEPVNPYGRTKLDGERMIAASPVRSMVLRQFNVVGAGDHPEAADTGVTNLMPAVFRALTSAGRTPVPVLGSDYPTRDGTAERDYVHVADVAAAYLRGLGHLLADGPEKQLVINVGRGRGHTVTEVLRAAGEVAGRPVPFRPAARRPGDPPAVVASVDRAARRLNWKAEQGLEAAIRSAWPGGATPRGRTPAEA